MIRVDALNRDTGTVTAKFSFTTDTIQMYRFIEWDLSVWHKPY